ncbi:predicted protein [Phaeodactylum tricornutum CCAP 1055/1]|uniref:Bestrophin homolog n=2 Tax=Phaeodactylum tricornutum TaxID=2850 RepID=B7G1R6_PHATC|nr:predicted protein [Phaeodactylum tricornutum CCAP 1055/1]EEC47732.1 predicted protein [Phaeodactylum tricornutum CCAP 1055/1]|eukprot:XP_002181080.1 predicted protein [Phaeodactylum tricornutum CCAP 1055/1]
MITCFGKTVAPMGFFGAAKKQTDEHMTSYGSHISVIFQVWGSKWPTVFPYCLFNVCVMVILSFVDSHFDGKYSVDVSTQGHGFLTLVVAFLLVSRVNTGLTRYESARDSIGVMYRECRELVQNVCVFTELVQRGAHHDRSQWEDGMRVPIRMAYLLRKTICSQAGRLAEPMAISHENKLLTFAHCFEVFLITYGFMGLEVVAMDLDNPFGDDPNDFDNSALACTAYEDTYLTILDIDGDEWMNKLRFRVHGQEGDCPFPDEKTSLLSSTV